MDITLGIMGLTLETMDIILQTTEMKLAITWRQTITKNKYGGDQWKCTKLILWMQALKIRKGQIWAKMLVTSESQTMNKKWIN